MSNLEWCMYCTFIQSCAHPPSVCMHTYAAATSRIKPRMILTAMMALSCPVLRGGVRFKTCPVLIAAQLCKSCTEHQDSVARCEWLNNLRQSHNLTELDVRFASKCGPEQEQKWGNRQIRVIGARCLQRSGLVQCGVRARPYYLGAAVATMTNNDGRTDGEPRPDAQESGWRAAGITRSGSRVSRRALHPSPFALPCQLTRTSCAN